MQHSQTQCILPLYWIELATVAHARLCQEIGAPAGIKPKPDVERRVSTSRAKFAYEYPDKIGLPRPPRSLAERNITNWLSALDAEYLYTIPMEPRNF